MACPLRTRYPWRGLRSRPRSNALGRRFPKGTDPKVDSYSGLFDNGKRRATGLGDFLKDRGVDQLYIVGLATDYCVKFTALDAAALGFKTTLIEDACRGVNLRMDDTKRAIDEMQHAGVRIVRSEDLPEPVIQLPKTSPLP